MSESFDAYFKWLGIPPAEQPPNHYRLLAIPFFTADADVIENAADQRMAHVRSFQSGKRAEDSQRILNEIAAARGCLLNPEKKAAYDSVLRDNLEPTPMAAGPLKTAVPLSLSLPSGEQPLSGPQQTAVVRRPMPRSHSNSVAMDASVKVAPRRTKTGKRYLPLVAIVGALAALFAVVVLAAAVGFVRRDVAQQPEVPHTPQNESGDGPADRGSDSPDSTDTEGREAPATGSATSDNGGKISAEENGHSPTDPIDVDAVRKDLPSGDTSQAKPLKSPQPESDAVTAARQRMAKTFANETPRQLMARVATQTKNDADTYFMLMMAMDSAAARGDIRTALTAVEELDARFVIDAFDLRRKLRTQLMANQGEDIDSRRLAEFLLTLADEAASLELNHLAIEMATEALKSARKSGDSDLVRKSTLTIVRLQED